MLTVREIAYKIITDAQGFGEGFSEANKTLEQFKTNTQAAQKRLDDMAKASAVALTAVGALAAVSIKFAVDFNREFGQVETLIPGAATRIKELKASIQELSVTSGKGTKDLTQGLYQVISAFGDSADATGQLELAAKAATAGAASTLESINLLSAVTKGYGDTSLEAQKRVGDLAFVTVKLGQTTFPELASAIQQVVPQSKALGVSQEELFSVFATGTGVIGGASEVATKYKAALENLMKPGKDMSEIFERLGVAGGEELIAKFGGFAGALDKVKKEAEAANIPFQNLFSSSEALTLALSFTGAQAETLREKLAAMKDSSGALDEAYAASTEGVNRLGHELDKTRAAAEVMAQRFGQELIDSSRDLIFPVLELVRGLSNMDEETLKTVVSVGKMIAVVASATIGVVALHKAIIAARSAMLAFNATSALSPLGIFVIAAAGVATGVWEMTKRLRDAEEAARKSRTQVEDFSGIIAETGKEAGALAANLQHLASRTNLSDSENKKLAEGYERLLKLYPNLSRETLEYAAAQGKLQEVLLKEDLAKNIQKQNELGLQRRKTESELIGSERKQRELILAMRKNLEENATIFSGGRNRIRGLSDEEILREAASKAALEQTASHLGTDSGIGEIYREHLGITEKRQLLSSAEREAEELRKQADEIRKNIADLGRPPAPAASLSAGESPGAGKKQAAERLSELDSEFKARIDLAKARGQDEMEVLKDYRKKRESVLEELYTEAAVKQKGKIPGIGALVEGGTFTYEQEFEATAALYSKTTDDILSDLRRVSNAQGLTVESLLGDPKKVSEAAKEIDGTIERAREKIEALKTAQAEGRLLDPEKLEREIREYQGVIEKLQAGKNSLKILDPDEIEADTEKDFDRLKRKLSAEMGTIDQETLNGIERQKLQATLEKIKEELSKAYDLESRGVDVSDTIEKLEEAAGKIGTKLKEETEKALSPEELIGIIDQSVTTVIGATQTILGTLYDASQERIRRRAEADLREAGERYDAAIADLYRRELDGLEAKEYQRAELLRQKREAELQAELDAIEARKQAELEALGYLQEETEAQIDRKYTATITGLERQLAQESNLEKRRELEKKIEEAKREKEKKKVEKQAEKDAEAARQKALEEEKTFQEKLARLEIEKKNRELEIEYKRDLELARSKRQQMILDRVATTAQVLAQQAIAVAMAYANGGPIFGPVLAGMVIASIAAQLVSALAAPLPEDPPPPKYIALAAGAIFPATPGGVPVTLPRGNAGKVAEAGVDEIYLPLTEANIEKFLSAARRSSGVASEPQQVVTFAPSVTVEVRERATLKEEIEDAIPLISDALDRYREQFLKDLKRT